MERSAWPKDLSSSRKRTIKELLHAQYPNKNLRDLFDAHSQVGNNKRQRFFLEDLAVNVLELCSTLSPSSSCESDEFLQVPTEACFRPEVSKWSSKTSVLRARRSRSRRRRCYKRRRTSDTWTKEGSHFWPPPPASPNQESLRRWIEALIKGAREREGGAAAAAWTYTIFWEFSDDRSNPVLGWGDGYFVGGDNATCSPAEQEHRKRVLRELNSLISGCPTADDGIEEEVTDCEWFFLVSMTQSFAKGVGLPGRVFLSTNPLWVSGADRLASCECERARQAQAFGLQTMAVFPVLNGVVELGSTELIPELQALVQMSSQDRPGVSSDQAGPEDNPPFYRTIYRGHHTRRNLILDPQSPVTSDSSLDTTACSSLLLQRSLLKKREQTPPSEEEPQNSVAATNPTTVPCSNRPGRSRLGVGSRGCDV